MLVVQNDANNARMANTILAFVTSNMTRAGESTQVFIDVSTADGKQSGLRQNSVVSCENILTVVQSDIIQTIGKLLKALMQEVDDALKASLALS